MNQFIGNLKLQKMVFDKICFERTGFRNDHPLKCTFRVNIGQNEDGIYKVSLVLEGDKPDEYKVEIGLSGFFTLDKDDHMDPKLAEELVNKNSVAILMPYLRSELTLLTAQPDTESIVLPPFNVNKMLKGKEE